MKILTAITLSLVSINALASGLTTSMETKNLCRNAVSLMSKGKIQESFNALKPLWPLPAAELDNLSYQTKKQLSWDDKTNLLFD